jgi:TolA-binding protein
MRKGLARHVIDDSVGRRRLDHESITVLTFFVTRLEVGALNVELQVDDFEFQVDDIEFQVDDVESRIDDVECQIDDVEFQVEDVEFRVEDVEFRVENVQFRVDDVEFRVDDVEIARHNPGGGAAAYAFLNPRNQPPIRITTPRTFLRGTTPQ